MVRYMAINFVIPGEPQGKARARTGKGFAYTPEKTANYEAYVKLVASQATKVFFTTQPLQIKVMAYYGIPKSDSKVKKCSKLLGGVRPTKKPDADNVLKIICDSLNNICYKDDTQIVNAQIEKWYSDNPRVEVELKEVV
jgi:Holliday junction resolvase RusA-like endonuclease